jgi:hypothetical protein
VSSASGSVVVMTGAPTGYMHVSTGKGVFHPREFDFELAPGQVGIVGWYNSTLFTRTMWDGTPAPFESAPLVSTISGDAPVYAFGDLHSPAEQRHGNRIRYGFVTGNGHYHISAWGLALWVVVIAGAGVTP